MQINKIIEKIEQFAPLELQSGWDNSGIQIDFKNKEIKKILLALTVNEKIIDQALEQNCDLIISHHPLFFVPFEFNKGIPIYSAHTNLDVAKGGTTDTLISLLEINSSTPIGDFLRVVDLEDEMPLKDFLMLVKDRLDLENIRVVNNSNKTAVKKIAFCAGSGADFLNEAKNNNADAFVTGDLKYHTAFDSDIILIDVGHFESERPVLNTIKKLLTPLNIEVVIANEKSPFINY